MPEKQHYGRRSNGPREPEQEELFEYSEWKYTTPASTVASACTVYATRTHRSGRVTPSAGMIARVVTPIIMYAIASKSHKSE